MSASVCIVTGAGRGLGRVIARHLHRQGHRVIVTDIDAVRAEALAAELDRSGATALGLRLDVREKHDFEDALERASEVFGEVSALINNAAVTHATPLFDISPDEFEEVLRVNLRGVFLGCQVFGAQFAKAGFGRIVNLASLAGQAGGTATGAHYAASKGGILTLTKIFARELASSGVTVNAIAPGPLDVPLVHELLSSDTVEALKRAIPVGHLGDPEFIAQVVALLVSSEARSVTGATWDANGGLYLR